MSRLYLKGKSDTRLTNITSTANQELTLEVYYGSKNNSKLALRVEVFYPKDFDTPTIKIFDLKNDFGFLDTPIRKIEEI